MRGLSRARQELGASGERLAASCLEREGCAILARNYRCALGEIDLIAEERGELVFVEVRTRRVGGLVGPVESVTGPKQRRVVRAAELYLQVVVGVERPWRVDIVAVEVDRQGRVSRVEHLRNVLESG